MTEVTTEAIQALVDAKCSPCHAGGGRTPPALDDITTSIGTASRGGTPLVEAGNRDNSVMYQRVSSPQAPMPPNGAPNGPMTPEEIEMFGAWIDGL